MALKGKKNLQQSLLDGLDYLTRKYPQGASRPPAP